MKALVIALLFTTLTPHAVRAAESELVSQPAPAPAPRAWLSFGPHFRAATGSRSVSHWGMGGSGTASFARRRVGVSLSGTFYGPLNPSQTGGLVRGLTETSVVAMAEGSWRFIAEPWFSAYLLGGTGLIWSRPVAVVDTLRDFEHQSKIAYAVGAGGRLRIAPPLAITIEGRDTIYREMYESYALSPDRASSATWYGASRLTQLFELQVGVVVELPL